MRHLASSNRDYEKDTLFALPTAISLVSKCRTTAANVQFNNGCKSSRDRALDCKHRIPWWLYYA